MDNLSITYLTSDNEYLLEGTYKGKKYRELVELDRTIPIEYAIEKAMMEFEEKYGMATDTSK